MTAIIIQINGEYSFVLDKDGIIHKIETDDSFCVGKEITINNYADSLSNFKKKIYELSISKNLKYIFSVKRIKAYASVAVACFFFGMVAVMSMLFNYRGSENGNIIIAPTTAEILSGDEEIINDTQVPLARSIDNTSEYSKSLITVFYILTICFVVCFVIFIISAVKRRKLFSRWRK